MRGLMWLVCAALMAQGVAGCGQQTAAPAIEAARPRIAGPTVRVAGDAVATPLMSRLAAAFSARHPGAPIVVDAPISSSGALRAWRSGAIDIALMVTSGDAPAPEGAVLLAETEPILVAGPGVRTRRITADVLAAVLRGENPSWPDGLARRVLLAPADDPAQRAFANTSPGLRAAFQDANRDRRWRVVHQAAALRQAIAETPGAIGVLDKGGLSLHGTPVWPVALTAGRPPDRLRLWILPDREQRARSVGLMAFVTGPEGRTFAKNLGYSVPRVAEGDR